MTRLIRFFSILLLPIFFMRLCLLNALSRPRVIVLIFHEISDREIKGFEKLVLFLHKWFGFIKPQELELFLSGQKDLEGPRFLISFDDGFVSSVRATERVLDPLGIKAAFFICSNFVEPDDEQTPSFIKSNLFIDEHHNESLVIPERWPMGRDVAAQLPERGHYVAAHTVNHAILAKLSCEAAQWEIAESKRQLSQLTKKPVNWFAYPFGGIDYIDKKSIDLIKENFSYCFSGIRGEIVPTSNHFSLPRSSVNLKESFLLQLALVLGVTNIVHLLKRRKLRSYT